MESTRRSPVSLIAGVVALLLVALMVTRTSEAAFTATTDNSGNSFSAASITLTDDDNDGALFTLSDLEPGDSRSACIEVTYAGTVTTPSAVTLYSGGYADDVGALSGHLNVTVEEGTGAGFTDDCSGFSPSPGTPLVDGMTLASFASTHSNFSNGAASWTPSNGESRSYRVTVELDAATPNTEQGASTTGVQFVWEVQS